MVEITMSLEETYQELDNQIDKVKKYLKDINNLIDRPSSQKHDMKNPESMLILIIDALIQVCSFEIEQILRQLNFRRHKLKQEIDEDRWLKGRAALLAADDLRTSLRESNYIINKDLSDKEEDADFETMQNAINVIAEEFNKTLEKVRSYKS